MICSSKQPGAGSQLLQSSFETNPTPKSSSVLFKVSLSVGAPVRVYLQSLVRRLLYSHLTPSTLSSTSPPTRPQSASALPSRHRLSSNHIAPWVTMSGVTINACLLLAPAGFSWLAQGSPDGSPLKVWCPPGPRKS